MQMFTRIVAILISVAALVAQDRLAFAAVGFTREASESQRDAPAPPPRQVTAPPPPPAQVAMPAAPPPPLAAPGTPPAPSAAPASPSDLRPRFDVASVRPNRSVTPPRAGFSPNGFEAVNANLRQLIELAYGGDPSARIDEVVGGPGWLGTDRFDIVARGPFIAAVDPQRTGKQMLQVLLEDRFQLRVHRERRERPIYALVVAHLDGRTGPALKPAPLDCHTRAESRPPGTSGLMYCGIDRLPGRSMGRSMPMHLLADTLSNLVGRRVVDRSGLIGEYDWDLEFTSFAGEPPSPDPGAPPPPAHAPTIFAAVQEQLGLRLDPDRAFLDVLVVDSVDRPTPN